MNKSLTEILFAFDADGIFKANEEMVFPKMQIFDFLAGKLFATLEKQSKIEIFVFPEDFRFLVFRPEKSLLYLVIFAIKLLEKSITENRTNSDCFAYK